MWERIGEALKMVYSANQFAEPWYLRQYEWRYLVYSASRYFAPLI
jgi:hypothetical protein